MFGFDKSKKLKLEEEQKKKDDALVALKAQIDSLTKEMTDFRTQVTKKLNDVAYATTVLDEDYFELKKNLTDIEKKTQKPADNKEKIRVEEVEEKILFLEKQLKELIVFGKLSLNNYETLIDLTKKIESLEITKPQDIILEEKNTDEEKDRFSKLEKEMDSIKNERVLFIDE